jgi:hypothetical protein
LCNSDPSIITATEVSRDEHGLPDEYLVLTDLLGGGVLMYRGATDEVFAVDFEGGVQALVAGQLSPRWLSFEEFLKEYFG